MTLTIKKMLAMFPDFQIIGGANGIDRKISTVSVMDAPDIHEWLKGGEFLITTGYIMRDNPMQIMDLLININQAGAAALGIKLDRFIKKLPENVIQKSDELGIPLIHIPNRYAFTDVINPVLSRIVNNQARLLELSENIHNSFTQMVIKGGDPQQIIDTLSSITGKEIAYIDLEFNKIWSTFPFSDLNQETINQVLIQYKSYPLIINNNICGYLIININKNSNLDEYENKALEHAITVLILELQKRILQRQIETRYRDQFILDIIFNNIKSREEVLNRAQIYGWKFTEGIIVLVIDIDNLKAQYLKKNISPEYIQEKAFKIARNTFHYCCPEAVWTAFTDNIVFLLETAKEDLDEKKAHLKHTCNKIKEKIAEETGFTVTIGIGNFYPCITEAHKSYQDALKAIQIGRNMHKGNIIIFYDELGIYKLLGSVCHTEIAEEIQKKYLDKIIEYDQNNQSELLLTLLYITKNDWNLKAAAREMFIHYNTIKYRFNKICSLLEIDEFDADEKLNIILALKLWYIKNEISCLAGI